MLNMFIFIWMIFWSLLATRKLKFNTWGWSYWGNWKINFSWRLRNVKSTSLWWASWDSILNRGGKKSDPAKIKAVSEWPTSTTCKQLQRFFGFGNFRKRIVWEYSEVAAPPSKLTYTASAFVWSPYVILFSNTWWVVHCCPLIISPWLDASDTGKVCGRYY